MFGFKKSWILLSIILAWALRYYTFEYTLLWYIFALILIGSIVLALGTYDHDYWAKKGVFSPKPYPFVGHIWSLITFKDQSGVCFKRIYDTYKNEKFLGKWPCCHYFISQ